MAQKLVMLITHDAELVPLVELVLAALNVTLVSTDDAPKAIRQLRLIRANLLLLDTAIPHALEAIQQLKASATTCDIPVVAMAYDVAMRSDEEARAARAAGADDVLLKPFEIQSLQEKVWKYLSRQAKKRSSDG